MTKEQRRNEGYTLIELLMVIAVLCTLFSVAIPGMLDARKTSYETSAIETLRVIIVSEEAFRGRNLGGNGNYGTLTQLEAMNLMAWPVTGNHFKNGFTFLDLLTPATTQWGVLAYPDIELHGDHDFAATFDGQIRTQSADVPSPVDIATAQAMTIYK